MPDESFNMGWGVQGSDVALASLQQIAAGIDKISQRGQETRQVTGNMFTRGIEQAGQFAWGLVGVQNVAQALQTTLRLVTAELDNINQRSRKAMETQVGAAGAEQAFLRALGPASQQERTQRTVQIQDTARKTGVSMPDVYRLAETVISGAGAGFAHQKSMDVTRMVAEAYRFDRPETQKAVAQAMLSIMKGRPDVSAEQALAGVINLIPVSRQTEVGPLATYAIPAIMQLSSYFDPSGKPSSEDWKSIGGFVMGVGQAADDPSGRRTATGTANFAKQMVMQSRARPFGFTGRSFDEWQQWAGVAGYTGTPEGLAFRKQTLGALWGADADQADAPDSPVAQLVTMFKQKYQLHTEAKVFPALLAYLRGEPQAPANLRIKEATEAMRLLEAPESLTVAREMQAGVEAGPAQRAARIQSRVRGGWQGMAFDDTAGGVRGALMEELPKLLQQAGGWAITTKARMTRFGAETAFADREGVLDSAEQLLKDVHPQGRWRGTRDQARWDIDKDIPVSGEQATIAAKLDEVIEALQSERRMIVHEKDADGVERPAAAAVEGAGR